VPIIKILQYASSSRRHNMKKIVLPIVLPIVAVVSLFAILHGVFGIAPWIVVRGSGPITDREYVLQEFNQVEVSSAIEFEITQSVDYSITITGYENLIERLEVDLSGRTLKIGLKQGNYFNNNVKAVIAMPEVNRLVVSGASRGTAKGFRSADDFNLVVSGASRAEIDIEAGETTVNVSGASTATGELNAQDTRLIISGSSRCELTGIAGDIDLNVSSASRANLAQFQIQNADVNISGASRATINMTGTLNIALSGASSLEYTGDAVLGKVNISGASTMSSK